jgi:hypothetical protein
MLTIARYDGIKGAVREELAVIKKVGSTFLVAILLVAMLLASGGCGRNGGTPPINPADKQQVTITLYFADQQAQHVIPEDRVVKQGTESTAELVVRELMAGPVDPYLHRTIPAGVQLLSVEVNEGIAYVNFSRELQENLAGGSASEMMMIESLLYSLTELEEVNKVQILIAGARQEVLAGHVSIMEPFARHGIKTYPIFLDAQRARYLQERVEDGQETWRLDPVEVAKRDGRMLGFTGADDFELVTLTPKSGSSGTAEAMVRATHGGQSYLLQLIQPVSADGIWMLNGIQEEV